jgi:hypothetical protein
MQIFGKTGDLQFSTSRNLGRTKSEELTKSQRRYAKLAERIDGDNFDEGVQKLVPRYD